ncbi:unnamed protein product [Schistosoma guineensis]|nr:unnamed protein product [Schistosoma guineensis]
MYNIIFVYLAVSFALINAAVGNSFGNDPAILAFKKKVINELKDYTNIQPRVLKIMEDVIKNVEDSTTNIRETERTLQAKIKIEKSWGFRILITYMKSNNNEEKCNQFKTFPEEDIKDLDELIAKKYMNIKSFNNGLFMHEFAVRNVDELISLAKKIGGNANEIFSLLHLNNQLFCAILCSSLCQVL